MGTTLAAIRTKISLAISSSGPFNGVIKLRQLKPESEGRTLFDRWDGGHGG